MTGYDASHALAEEYSSAQKDKNIHNIRRDYSAESLVKYNTAFDSGKKNSSQKEPISPYNSEIKQPLSQKKVSYGFNTEQYAPAAKDFAMNYYNSDRVYKKPENIYESRKFVAQNPSAKENSDIRISPNNKDRYKKNYINER